jgi:hypothetical protein
MIEASLSGGSSSLAVLGAARVLPLAGRAAWAAASSSFPTGPSRAQNTRNERRLPSTWLTVAR